MTVEDKLDRIDRNLRLKQVPEVPFLVDVGGFHGATVQYFTADSAELAWNVKYHSVDHAGVDDYGIPNIKPNMGIGIVAAAFGCAQTPNDEADPWIKARITEDTIGDVHTLQIPDPAANPVYLRAWERVEYLEKKSDLPLRVVNIPSPLVTASLIWEYTGFIEALMVYPEEVHVLMDKITKATIAYVHEQFRRIRKLHSVSHEMWSLPRTVGLRISDDTAALLSPDLYREFGVTYNSRIAREFGGIVVHSCGDVRNVVAAMTEIEGLAGLDFTIPQNPDWSTIRDAAAGKVPLFLRHFHWDHGNDLNINLADYSRKLVDYFGASGLFIQTSTKTQAEARQLADALHGLLTR